MFQLRQTQFIFFFGESLLLNILYFCVVYFSVKALGMSENILSHFQYYVLKKFKHGNSSDEIDVRENF